MAVIILDFLKGNKDNEYHAFSLVSCEHPDHVGGRLRVIGTHSVKNKNSAKICRKCCLKGKIVPRETVELIASKTRGQKRSPETLKRMSEGRKGIRHSEETKKKMSLSHTGVRLPKDRVERMRARAPRGENHHNWNPNLTQEEREKGRNFPELDIWREEVYKRDNYTCQITGHRGCKLAAHHIDGWNWYKAGWFDINNGITLSEEMHDLFHKHYGKGDNTRVQFEEFKSRYMSGEFVELLTPKV